MACTRLKRPVHLTDQANKQPNNQAAKQPTFPTQIVVCAIVQIVQSREPIRNCGRHQTQLAVYQHPYRVVDERILLLKGRGGHGRGRNEEEL